MLKALSVISGARVVSTAAQAVTLLVLARTLGPAEFGRFAAVLGGLTALSLLADGGATAAVGRHHAASPMIVQILRAARLLSLATLVVSVPVLAVVAHVSTSPAMAACLLLCAWVPLDRQAEVMSAYLLARNQESIVGAIYLLRRVPTLAAVLLAPTAVSVVAAFSAIMVATAGLAVAVLGRRTCAATGTGDRIREQFVLEQSVWTVLRPFWMVVAGLGVRQIDVAVLGMTAGASAAGVFAPASRLVPALLLVPGTYTQLLLGRLAAGGQRLTSSPVIGVAAASTVAFVPLAVLADAWVLLVLGDAYTASVDVVRVVVVSLVLAALSSVFASALHAANQSARVAVAVWTGAATTVAGIAVLGAMFGAIGAAVAVAAGYLVQLVLMAAFHMMTLERSPPYPQSGAALSQAG